MRLKQIALFILLFTIMPFLFADTLNIVYHKNYYPYAFENEAGKPDGVLIDYWKLWGHDNNTDVQFIAAYEKDFIHLIQNDVADILAGTAINDTFSSVFDYSEYILRINTVLFLAKNQKPKSIHNISFPILVFENNHTMELLSNKYPELKTEICANFHTFFEKLNSGNYNGFIYDYPTPITGKNNFKIPKGYYSYLALSSNRIRPAVKKEISIFGTQLLLDHPKYLMRNCY